MHLIALNWCIYEKTFSLDNGLRNIVLKFHPDQSMHMCFGSNFCNMHLEKPKMLGLLLYNCWSNKVKKSKLVKHHEMDLQGRYFTGIQIFCIQVK